MILVLLCHTRGYTGEMDQEREQEQPQSVGKISGSPVTCGSLVLTRKLEYSQNKSIESLSKGL
jgi:hypothetical protein